ncbi:MAG: CYTH domain-containing protein [Saprospiraceae bacterium]
MAQEIERKFLLKNSNWRKEVEKSYTIQQGYLSTDKKRTVRIRIKDTKGIITIKGETQGMSRLEFEYEIPLTDGNELIGLCHSPIIKKTRHIITHENLIWEIDVFEGKNQGLILAEVELESEEQKIILPTWIGQEVTDDVRYYNSNLVAFPFSEW